MTRLQRVVRSVATSIYGDVKDLFIRHTFPSTVIPAKVGMTKRSTQLPCEVMFRRDQPKTWPERQWPLAESRPHVCAPASSYLSPNRLVFRCFLGDFFCTSKRSYSAAGPRPGAVFRNRGHTPTARPTNHSIAPTPSLRRITVQPANGINLSQEFGRQGGTPSGQVVLELRLVRHTNDGAGDAP